MKNSYLRVLMVDAETGFYKLKRYSFGKYFGPCDLGMHLADNYHSLNIGAGIFAGSILPGSNRLMFSGFSPCWRGFYISSMGGAALIFDNLGINMLSIIGKSAKPTILYLNRNHGEDIDIDLIPVDINNIWKNGKGGIYSVFDTVHSMFADKYENDPRILAVGPAAASTDFAGIASAPIIKGKITHADTWAGRGGFGSKLFQDHGICGIIYGGTFIDEDFRDRKVADEWFREKYNSTLAAKDLESTVKYRYDPKFTTGGTFGVNYATIGPRIMAFNYNTIYKTEEDRKNLHQKFVLSHYLKQFNEETIEKKQQSTCGEPCAAVCKKLNGKFKKDYEPYQTLGPQSGIFDQRAAEKLNNYADQMGFDAINAGCLISWLFELLSKDIFTPEELGISGKPYFNESDFDIEKHSMHNAELGIEILDSILNKTIDISEGPRKWARKIHRQKNIRILDHFVYNANGRRGWMTPNQYWTAGVLSPMAIMGKYYMVYDDKFYSPRELGRKCADRLKKELILDNLGVCRFHRGWAEEMLPEILDKIYGMKDEYFNAISILAGRINSRNASVYWESQKNIDFIYAFLKRRQSLECEKIIELDNWINEFEKDKKEASLNFWFEIRKGIDESLRDFL